MKPEEVIASQAAEIEKLTKALIEIEQMSDCGSYAQAVIRMKDIASKALTGRKKFKHTVTLHGSLKIK